MNNHLVFDRVHYECVDSVIHNIGIRYTGKLLIVKKRSVILLYWTIRIGIKQAAATANR